MQKTRGISSRGLLRRMAVRLRDQAGREVVHGDREIDQADCEDGVYSFHFEPPSCVFFILFEVSLFISSLWYV